MPQALNSMLEKDQWRRLPVRLPALVPGAPLPRHSTSNEQQPAEAAEGAGPSGRPTFEYFASLGNPWRRQEGD